MGAEEHLAAQGELGDPAALTGRLFRDMAGALELLTVYLGERLGLYRALHADGPATSAELAARTGTTERYIREWLEHHAASGLLEVDDPAARPLARRYGLPPGHAPVLADAGDVLYQAFGGTEIVRAARWMPQVAADASGPGVSGQYDLVTIIEALHDMSRPVDALRAARGMLREPGCVIVADELVEDEFTAPASIEEQYHYGWSVVACLPAVMGDPDTAATGAMMRPATLRRYALEAGFGGLEILPVKAGMLRFYRLTA